MVKVMGITKRLTLQNIFIFLFFAIFPFGQIIRVGVLHPLDTVAFIGGFIALALNYKKPALFKFLENFLVVLFFGWIFSFFIFESTEILYGFLYLLRLAAYFYFFLYIYNFVKKSDKNKQLVLNSLLLISVVSAFFGWIQFFWVPDIKPFFTYGWDEHLFRLVGTFLDPTYLGLIIVFGLLLAIDKKIKTLFIFLFVSLAFTYSRASYLAFLAGAGYLAFASGKLGRWVLILASLIIIVLALPTSKNHSIEITRMFSVVARVENYKTTLGIFKESPIFGVGFNNLCLAYNRFVGYQSVSSHACSGSDSSILFLLATGGIAGLFSFLLIARVTWRFTKSKVFRSVLVALIVHSLFSNSLFYPWILSFVLVLLAMFLGDEMKGE